jgi:hypothetical protein
MRIRPRAAAFAPPVAVAAMAALGLVELATGEALAGLHPYPPDAPAWLVRASGATLAIFAACALRWPGAAAALLALLWLAAAAWVAASLNAADPLAYVALAQAVVFALFAVWLWRRPQAFAQALLRAAFGLMLLLFGAIHLAYAETIASIIPDFIPARALWPWFTGAVQGLAGLSCLAGRGAAAGLVALMYAAWLPIVHGPRLLASPSSAFEWSFALTALALAGIGLAIATAPDAPGPAQDRR